MRFRELFPMAFEALRRHKLRSGLTLLGVIIGVMTVVSVLSIISGLNDYVTSKVINLSPDVLIFTKYGIMRSRNEFVLARQPKPVTMRDARVVEATCRSCETVGTETQQRATVRWENRHL